MPNDIRNLIGNEKVIFRKATLWLMETQDTHNWPSNLSTIFFAWQELDLSRYENDHGPSGDCGNYESQTLETSQVEYKAAIDRWNGFIDEFEYLSHLLRGFHADRFYHIDHSDCE